MGKQIFIDKKVKEDGIPSLIINGLYLGSIGAAKNLEWLKSNGITHILCVAGGIGSIYPKQFEYKIVDIDDAPNEDITVHFEACYDFIESALQKDNGRVLVHCFAGMSRSVTVVSAYLMQKKRMLAVPALKFVKLHRNAANPNAGFIVQLIKYQKVIGLTQNEKKKTFKGLALGALKKRNMEQSEKNIEDKKENKIIETKKNGHHTEENNEDIELNSPMVKQWENGRRPSLFTALAKLRGLKNRVRNDSMDS